jgi:hypothetical protein
MSFGGTEDTSMTIRGSCRRKRSGSASEPAPEGESFEIPAGLFDDDFYELRAGRSASSDLTR